MYKILSPGFKYSFLTAILLFIPFTITTAIREAHIMKRLNAPKTAFWKVFKGHVINNWANMLRDLYWSSTGKYVRKKMGVLKMYYIQIRDRKMLAEAKEKQSKLSEYE